MAEAAAARREARRRRILENSHNRLQLISGKNGEDCSRVSPVRTTITAPDSHGCGFNNGVVVTEQESFESLPIPSITSLIRDIPVSEGEVVNDLAFSTPRVPDAVQEPLLEKLLVHKYDIVLLSLFTQILYGLALVTHTSYFFLPVIIYSMTKMIYFPTKSNSNISHALMLLNLMSSSSVQKVIQLMQTVNYVFGDVCIFLFTIICVQSLSRVLEDNLIT